MILNAACPALFRTPLMFLHHKAWLDRTGPDRTSCTAAVMLREKSAALMSQLWVRVRRESLILEQVWRCAGPLVLEEFGSVDSQALVCLQLQLRSGSLSIWTHVVLMVLAREDPPPGRDSSSSSDALRSLSSSQPRSDDYKQFAPLSHRTLNGTRRLKPTCCISSAPEEPQTWTAARLVLGFYASPWFGSCSLERLRKMVSGLKPCAQLNILQLASRTQHQLMIRGFQDK